MKRFFFLLFFCPMVLFAKVVPPAPFGAVPTARQLEWHDTEFYAFIHFTTNTFCDLEWGYGDADPDIFCPENLDAEQWVRAMKAAGMKGVVLTAKHHDGFCLWPSQYTDYSVKNSKWLDGKGDVVRAVSDAARKYGLKFGVYLSPWDRHDLRYASPEYITYYRNQLNELLTQYGPIFEVWEDGANGGDGYYGGRREARRIQGNYYDWGNTNMIIRELQPKACVFGGDVRWCGNESGYIDEPWWCEQPVSPENCKFMECDEKVCRAWRPAEVDVSIRPGWFWHESENSKVRTVDNLLDIYYSSVGRGANLILNTPPNSNGLFSDEDVRSLEGLGEALKKEFGNCLNKKIVKSEASNTRGGSKTYSASKAIDGKKNTYYAADDDHKRTVLTYTFAEPTTVNRASISEYIQLGQRVSSFCLEALDEDGLWKEIDRGSTIGHKHLLRFPDVKTKALRFVILESKACPVISDIKFFDSPLKLH